MTDEDEFDEAFKGFGEEPETPPVETPPVDPAAPPAAPVATVEPPKPVEEPDKNEPAKTPETPEKDDPNTPAGDADKKEEEPKPAEAPAPAPETPAAPEAPQPITKEDVTSIIQNIRLEERNSGQALEQTTAEVMNAYYPEGLSNVLVDEKTGKELRTPQDVVDATGGEMPMDQAAQWLMNEQFKLDQNVAKIKDDARSIAETTLKFKQDGMEVLQRYEPLFKAYPQIQQRAWDQYIKLVKADESKGVVLSAPDMREYYDLVLEPYRLAYAHSTGQAGTAPITPEPTPVPAPGTDDILDEGGDGGLTAVNDPNDFAQQVTKELAKEF